LICGKIRLTMHQATTGQNMLLKKRPSFS